MVIFGVECLLIDTATLSSSMVDEAPTLSMSMPYFQAPAPISASRIFKPAEWMPWSFLAFGAIVVLYALTIRRAGAT